MRWLITGLLLVSCGAGVSPALDDGLDDLTLDARLRQGVQLALVPGDSWGSIDARQPAATATYQRFELRPIAGNVWLERADGECGTALRLRWLQVRLADVALFDSGVTLRELRVTGAPAEGPDFRTTLSVAGSWCGPGGACTPFETQRFEGVPIALSLWLDGGEHVNARFRIVSREVPSFRWDDLLETGAAELVGTAAERAAQAAAPQ